MVQRDYISDYLIYIQVFVKLNFWKGFNMF